jgi:tRNA(Ile)-lysidine synthase
MDLHDRVAATGLLDRRPLVLLSGGQDSVCLLDCAARLAGPGEVRALHVHHGLRGAAADEDELACRALCAALEVTLEVVRLTPPDLGGASPQAWAREARYAAARDHAGGGPVAAAHTATDQAETVLYRLATSPGRRALLGMPADDGRGLLRPLLAAGVTRAETAAHCGARGLPWREDATNADPAYARTRVRATLVPALEAVDARAVGNVLRTAELLREEAAVLDELVDGVLAGRDHLGRDELAALPRALARLVLRRLAEDATGTPCPRAAGRLEDVLALGDGMLDVGDGARVVVGGGAVRVRRR